jgi:hypothetical protein
MADDASCLQYLTDSQFLAHFEQTYPQRRTWQLLHLSTKLSSELNSILRLKLLTSPLLLRPTCKAKNKLFGVWTDFCQEFLIPPSLYTIGDTEDKPSYLLVFALQYCKHRLCNTPVRADTVKTALTTVGTGISDLGVQNPCKPVESDMFYPLLTDFIRSLNKEDDPAGRVYPACQPHYPQSPARSSTPSLAPPTCSSSSSLLCPTTGSYDLENTLTQKPTKLAAKPSSCRTSNSPWTDKSYCG